MSRFVNPPIVEGWLAFDFEPAPDKVDIDWDMKRVEDFTTIYKDIFPNVKVAIRSEFTVEESQDGKLPKVVNQNHTPNLVRLSDDSSKRVLQIANDRMVFNILEGGQDWPGFETLVAESLENVLKYQEFFQPSGIRNATLFYLDIITIPISDGEMEIGDYFNLARDIDVDPFGFVQGFLTVFVTQCPRDDEPLRISLTRIPKADSEPQTVRFRLEWEKKCCKGIDFSTPKSISQGLSQSHEYMVECFEKSITEKTRSLFSPR